MNKKTVAIILVLGICCLVFQSCAGDEELDKSSLVNQFREVAKLATVRIKLRKILWVEKTKKFLFFKLGKATHLSYIEPIIEAGIDLDKLTEENITSIDSKNRVIKIKLPPVEITKYDYNFDEVQEDFNYSKDKPLIRIDLADIEEHHRMADKEIRKFINHLGIRERAEKSTETFIREYLGNISYRAEISFEGKGEPLVYYDLWQES